MINRENVAFNIMEATRNMSNLEYEIFKFLYNREDFEGNYTDLTLAIGQKKPNEPNVRKAVRNLEKKYKIVAVIYVKGERKTHPMKACYLCEGWENTLAEAYNWQ